MAKINFGTVVNDARGKLNGSVFSKNKSGAYVRKKVTPANPNTIAQASVRESFGVLAQQWSGLLTASERAAWISYAATYPRLDIFGASITLSGLNMYLSLNRVLNQIGEDYITMPPATNVVAPIPWDPTTLNARTTPTVNFNETGNASDIHSVFYIFGTRPLPPGRKAQRNDFRFLAVKPQITTPGTGPVDVTTEYVALFGGLSLGQRVGVLVSTVDNTTGLVTAGTQAETLVVGP